MADTPGKRVHVRSYTRRVGGKKVRVREHVRSTEEGEFAPGIPSEKKRVPPPHIKHPQHWYFSVQDHKAIKRGPHLDLRLGTRGKAYSWVPIRWPNPGESVWAIEQPTHTQEYMSWEGEIPEGEYGAGKVEVSRKGPTIVYESGPDKVNFTIVDGRKTEDLALIRTHGRMWKLVNYTPKEGDISKYQFKPKYKSKEVEKLDPYDDTTRWKAKIDGAHGVAILMPGKRPRIFSYRAPKKGGFIEWTHKIPGAFGQKVPAGIGPALVRVEVWAQKNNKPMDSELVAGMLNANTLKSRQLQKERGSLRPALIDVISWKKDDLSGASGDEKEEILQKIQKAMPIFGMPDTAETPAEKVELLKAIAEGRHPQTAEGIVEVPKGKDRFTKAKFRPEQDVYVREIYEGKSGTKWEGRGAGGFRYSRTPHGKIVGNVGTGFTDEQRIDMFRNPGKYIDRVARVRGMKYRSGVGRSLSFLDWHPEKGALGGYTQHELKPAESR